MHARSAILATLLLLACVTHPGAAVASPSLGGSAPAASGPTSPTGLSAPRDVLEAIDGEYRAGRLDEGTAHLYRAAAIRAPERLPAALAGFPAPRDLRSGTRVLAEAFQWVARQGAWGGEIHALLQPPPDEAFVLESTLYPVQISFPEASQQAYAEMLLAAAEHSFAVQVDGWGFWMPPLEPGYEPYRILIGETGQGVAGYTAPYDENPATPWIDCFTYIVINPNLGDSGITTMAHELNHAMQAAMDCSEVTTYWENTATYIEGQTYPEWEYTNYYMIPFFQSQPWRALDYFENGGGYQYGGVLWNYFLVDRIAPEDGPVLIREIWEASVQTSWQNEPDYFDAIERVASARGEDATRMETLYEEFAEARYFVGSRDDGQHIAGAAEFFDSELTLTARHQTYTLPLRDEQPPTSRRPAPFGANHIQLDIEPGWQRPVTVRLATEGPARWAARVVLLGEGQVTDSQPLPLDETGAGELVVDPTGYERLLLVVVNLGPAGYDPDASNWPLGEYTYSLEAKVDPPVLHGIFPGAVTRGSQNLHLRLVGAGFVYGREFAITFTDPLLQVASIDAVRDTEVLFTLTVPASANAGAHHVTVVNAGGASATLERALLVTDEIGPPDPGRAPRGCSAAGGGASSPLWLLALVALLFSLRRRRR